MAKRTDRFLNKLAYGIEPSQRYYKLRLARYKSLAESIAAFVKTRNLDRPLRLLDMGLGNGRTLRYLEAEGVADKIEFFGVDLQRRRLAKVYAPKQWNLFQADIQQGVPFGSEWFDIVICEQVLEHLSDPNAAIEEMTRVLRPNGLLLIGVPIFPPGIHTLRKIGVWISMNWCGLSHSHLNSFNIIKIKRMILTQNTYIIQSCIGFRILSGGPFAPLEDFQLWYRFNRIVGRLFPWLCTEIQLTFTKREN